METINIITRCTRPDNLLKIRDSIETTLFKIKWFIIFDTSSIKNINGDLLTELQDSADIKFIKGEVGDFGHNLINGTIDRIKSGFIYVLDDDNILHEDFFKEIKKSIKNNPNAEGFVFNQKVGGKDFTGLDIRLAKPENMKVRHIDMAQFILKRELIGDKRIPKGIYIGDGIFIENLYQTGNKSKFVFIDKVLCHYNYFTTDNKGYCLPRILVLGTQSKLDLKSNYVGDFESNELKVMTGENDDNLVEVLNQFNPDSIVTIGPDIYQFQNMGHQPYEVRKRWLHFNEYVDGIGEASYQCGNNYILSHLYDDGNPLISYFTPIHNTGDILRRTYESLQNQSYNNWEWVIVNDSTDGDKTLSIAEEISKGDYRVKVYDFKQKSGGIVGESKYRAASLCNGKYLVELDHDDYLLPDASDLVISAFKKYPDAKFVYSDCVEINDKHESLQYGEGFCFGYGEYRDESWNGHNYKVINTPNINPKTIRHIVGVPNHLRAWDRIFYHSIGGHNRRLTIADDYELIVRTFLNTRMVKIPKLLYLQFYHNNNTQDATRGDIQRRVRSIMLYYNQRIKDRFNQLGAIDWAYDESPNYPLFAESRFNEREGYVNYIFNMESGIEYHPTDGGKPQINLT